ncbi:MAG: glutathione S-transferase C-terminal domain-containing protein [Candidatus Binatia bacterium]|nr:glutathione S-transferase C-terminal domain-containing protein [Candidatus Binatia bacterium]
MDYLEVEDGRKRDGLRLVLTTGGPGPWSEAAKGIFQVKGLAFAPVRQVAGEQNQVLQEWTGQSSAPVAVWNDDPPCATSRTILWLAERLAPEPALVPRDPEERATCLGVCDEIHGENGFGWCRRLGMFAPIMEALGEKAADSALGFMAWKYGYSPQAAARAENRIVEILGFLAARLARQRDAGRRYLVGDRLTAADIYWAAFAAMVAPLSAEVCPMPDGLRDMYTVREGRIAVALDPALIAHRDFIYQEHLELPLRF